jgi:hypothetical protein
LLLVLFHFEVLHSISTGIVSLLPPRATVEGGGALTLTFEKKTSDNQKECAKAAKQAHATEIAKRQDDMDGLLKEVASLT